MQRREGELHLTQAGDSYSYMYDDKGKVRIKEGNAKRTTSIDKKKERQREGVMQSN